MSATGGSPQNSGSSGIGTANATAFRQPSSRFSNKKYKGEDFAILTEEVTVISGPALMPQPMGRNSATRALAVLGLLMTVESELPVYHPQADFTSLHTTTNDSGVERVTVARAWFDLKLIEPGVYPLVVDITYTDVKQHHGPHHTRSRSPSSSTADHDLDEHPIRMTSTN